MCCEVEENVEPGVEHILPSLSRESRQVWSKVEDWIIELGFSYFTISNKNILVGDNEDTLDVKSITF